MFDFLGLSGPALATLLGYSLAVILASIFGGLLPEWIRLTHTRMQLMISFVGGLMLGISVFHMVPHAIAVLGIAHIDQVTGGVMLGLLVTFFLLRFFHFHQHGPADFGIHADELRGDDDDQATHLCSEHHHPHPAQTHSAEASDSAEQQLSARSHSPMRWLAVLIGLGVHTLIDGVALASGVVADTEHGHAVWLPGFGIFLAVLLHKPLDAVSITSLMHPVTTSRRRMLVNVGFALMCPAGAGLFVLGTSLSDGLAASFAGWGLAFSAGVFLCIALSDLLPEMEFHSHSRLPLSAALLAGILAAWAIGLAEGEHAHQPPSDSPAIQNSHDHSQDH